MTTSSLATHYLLLSTQSKPYLQIAIFICIFLFSLLVQPLGAKADNDNIFPVFPTIETNVAFWHDIYSSYTTTQGVLHDKDHLDIVYGVINLVEWDVTGSARINRQLIKLAKNHYNTILRSLDKGEPPTTADQQRVAALFKGRKTTSYKKARNNIRLQIGQKDRFLQGVIRSGKYMYAIKNIFKAYDMPPELAYLPHVESSFNPEAHSKASAAGLWQFTRSTGKRYLTINTILDERYDPIRSTHAAALFLKTNHTKLGNWPLAITAYNYGPAGMRRAAELHGSYENIFNNHTSKIFKFASRNFYPEFLAALQVARQLEKDPLLVKDRPEAILSIRLKNYISLSDLSKHFKISQQDLTRLNPSFRSSILKGNKYIPKNVLVRVPATQRTRPIASTIPDRLYHSSQLTDSFHIVRRGDTATSIADTYKIKVDELIRLNKLNRHGFITIGQRLQLPLQKQFSSSSKRTVISTNSKWKPKSSTSKN